MCRSDGGCDCIPYTDLIDALLAHPNFSMANIVNMPVNVNTINAFEEVLNWRDESMMMKLLSHKQMNDELLMTGKGDENGFVGSLLLNVVRLPYALPLIEKLITFAAVRDQVSLMK